MGLEIRKNRFVKWYENAYFRILASKLTPVFSELNINGVLIGSGICYANPGLQPDILLICESAVILIDLKKYGGKIELPEHDTHGVSNWKDKWYQGYWNLTGEEGKWVRGGARNNPFQQLEAQTNKLNALIEDNIKPGLETGENCELKHTQRIVCFQLNVDFEGSIDPRHEHSFHVADPRTIVNKIRDIVDVSPHEYKGEVTGYKLGSNAFNLFKKEFRADLYDPEARNELYEKEKEFDQIEYPATEVIDKHELVAQEFEKNIDVASTFISSDQEVLIINGDQTAGGVEFVEKLIHEYYHDGEEEVKSKICYLAPTNRNVQDLIRNGAPVELQSLYAKLYDFENTSIELLKNSINEKEVFPLRENKDEKGTTYVLYYSHLVYDFGSNDDDLVRFGSGSLCNDALEFFDLQARGNKLILINDPYHYGYRASTIATKSVLEENEIFFEKIDLESKANTLNEKAASELVSNIDKSRLNHFLLDENSTEVLQGDEFKSVLSKEIEQKTINNCTVLTREKNESVSTNKWIRKELGITEPHVVEGDLLLIKNKVLVPEEYDPFTIPKYILSGDIAEVKEVVERNVYRSDIYNMKPIEVTKCKVYLKDYESERFVYVLDKSVNFLTDNFKPGEENPFRLIKQHIQIRKQEIVDEFLKESNIELRELFTTDEFEKYNRELKELSSSDGLLEGVDLEVDKEKLSKKIKTLDAKWDVNKRKENYVWVELMKKVDSEYFQLSELAYYTYAWSISVKASYGYTFPKSYLLKFANATDNIERFHKYLYSSYISSQNLSFHDFHGITPWMSIELDENVSGVSEKSKEKLVVLNSDFELDEKDKFLSDKYGFQDKSKELLQLCRWIHDKLGERDDVKVFSIQSPNYLEKYNFEFGGVSSILNFYYNGKWEVKFPTAQNANEQSNELIRILSRVEEIPLKINPEKSWRSYEYSVLNKKLSEQNLFVSKVDGSDWKDVITVSGNESKCSFELCYNNYGFFSYHKFIYKTNDLVVRQTLEALKSMKS